MKRELFYCDLCGAEIERYDAHGTSMIDSAGWNQVWPREGKEPVDVCHNCCDILDGARRRGLITFDDAPLFLAAGYVKHESGAWVKKVAG